MVSPRLATSRRETATSSGLGVPVRKVPLQEDLPTRPTVCRDLLTIRSGVRRGRRL